MLKGMSVAVAPAAPARDSGPALQDAEAQLVASMRSSACLRNSSHRNGGRTCQTCRPGWVINLQDEPRVDHGLILALEHRCHGIDVCLVRWVIRVEEEAAEPAWPQDWEEVLDLRAGLHDARFDDLKLMLDGVLAFVCHGASDHRLVRRLWVDDAWPDVANLVIDFIEPLNSGICRSCWCTRMEGPSPAWRGCIATLVTRLL